MSSGGVRPRATRRGNRLDWVKFDFELARDGSVDPTDKALYAAIASFVDVETRESPDSGDIDLNVIPEDVPTRKRLAECIGRSMDTVDRSTKRLEDRRLLKVHRQADPANPKLNLPSEYELLDHVLWDERAAARAERRAARRQAAEGNVPGEGGSRTSAATPGRAHAATPGRTGAAVKDSGEVEEEKEEGDEAVSPRSGGDARRASAGSTREGGFAASGKTAPSPTQRDDTRSPAAGKKDGSKKAGHSREQLDVVRRVRAFFPPEIRERLPELPVISDAILSVMATEGRTVEELGQRIQVRWERHNYAALFHAGKLESVVGAAIGMVRPLRRGDRYACANIRCEDGVLDGEPCRLCAVRIADQDAARAREYAEKRAGAGSVGADAAPAASCATTGLMPPQRAAQGPTGPSLVMCEEPTCRAPIRPGGEPLCPDCLKAAEDAARAQIARWEAEAAAAKTSVEPEPVDAEAEETARIRAELAAKYGTPEEVAAYCNPARSDTLLGLAFTAGPSGRSGRIPESH